MRAKYRIYLTPEERRIVINSLIDLRNNLISQGMYTDLVDELIIRISKIKAKRLRLRRSENGYYIYNAGRLFAAELNTARTG